MRTSALVRLAASAKKAASAAVVVAVLAATAHAQPDGSPDAKIRERCGWFDNPSPGNATLSDRDGEWTVAMQGAASAEGDWPMFKRGQWVHTGHSSQGYGCACLKVRETEDEQRITHILGARAKALSACRRDKALTEPENPAAIPKD